MNIIYLSGPMSGISDFNFPEFDRVAAELRAKGYEVISPAEIDQPVKQWTACMRNDIPELLKADTIALLKEWDSSAGARIEVAIAWSLGMNIVDAYTLEPIELHMEVKIEPRIQAGDSVHHGPSNETWYILGVNYTLGDLCVAGYPPTIAKIKDCTLIEKGNGITEDELKHRNSKFGTGWEA